MKIGELAQQTGASIRSLRYYDAMGLLATKRSANGYRLFASDAVSQVKQIRTLLASGFSIAEILLLLPCLQQQEAGSQICEAALLHYHQKLVVLDEQIQTLQGIRQRIQERLQLALPHESEKPT
jgi:DNA-binding transcriptional MerR regulator